MQKLLILIFLFTPFYTIAKLKVFTTTSNLADIVRQVGGDDVEVESLCKGTQDPHFLEAKPSYTFKLSRADLLVSIGAGLEVGWLPLVIRGSRNPSIREGEEGHLVASYKLSLLEKIEEDDVSRADGDVHPEGNPHFLLSPKKAYKVAQMIVGRLSKLDAVNKQKYQQRLERFSKEIEKVMANPIGKKLKGKKVITYHKTLTYFYHDFGIINVDVLEPKPGVPPTASHIIKLISEIKENNIKKIIVENYFDESVAKRIKVEIPSIQIEVVPVAVEGRSDITSIISLYNYLLKRIDG